MAISRGGVTVGGKRAGDYIGIEAAQDYYKAQQPELDALRKTGNYSAWQYMQDLPAVAAARFNIYRKSDRTDFVDGNSTGEAANALMEQMREAAKRQYSGASTYQDAKLKEKWNDLKSGWIYMKVPKQK